MTDIVKVDPKEFGLEESKAADIAAQFKPMLDKMVELEKEYNEVILLPVESNETAIKAKTLRMKYVKVRTGTADIHKTQKAFYLAAGRFIDGWKNTQLFASEGIEKKLEDIEKFYENERKKKESALQAERELLLQPYEVENTSSLSLGVMTEGVWESFLLGSKTSYENKKEAERIAEENRLAAIEAEKKRIEEQRIENERLRKEAEEKELALQAERAETARLAKIEADKQAAILKAQQEKAAAERKAIEDKARKEKAAADAKLKAEREANEKLQAELNAKKAEAELIAAKAAADLKAKQLAEKKAANAPIKDRIKAAINSLSLEIPQSDVTLEIQVKFEGFKKWALQQTESL